MLDKRTVKPILLTTESGQIVTTLQAITRCQVNQFLYGKPETQSTYSIKNAECITQGFKSPFIIHNISHAKIIYLEVVYYHFKVVSLINVTCPTCYN